jgi:large subunit ribosomal protein L10
LALSKDKKKELHAQYVDWLKEGRAVFLVEYIGMNMADFDGLRKDVRDADGEFHVVKNTLLKRAFADAEMDAPQDMFLGSTALGVAFQDAPAIAKAFKDFSEKKDSPLKIKGGYMDGRFMQASEVHILADLPPLPVMRAKLLGLFNTPAQKLVGVLNEPGASLARVVKAYSEKGAEAAAA